MLLRIGALLVLFTLLVPGVFNFVANGHARSEQRQSAELGERGFRESLDRDLIVPKMGASTHVVRGSVVNVTSFWEDGSIVSIAEMTPRSWVKNSTEFNHVFLRYDGGRVGNIRQIEASP